MEFEIQDGVLKAIKNLDSSHLIIPEGVMVLDGHSLLFEESKKITKISFPSTLQSVDEATFGVLNNLHEVHIGKCLKLFKIENDCLYSYNSEILYTSLNNIEFVKVIEGCKAICSCAFASNKRIRQIKLPHSLEYIGTSAFSDSALESVDIPDSVVYICDFGFKNCNNLESVKLSEKLCVINNQLFNGCDKLKEIYIPKFVAKLYGGKFFDKNTKIIFHSGSILKLYAKLCGYNYKELL